MNYKLLAALFLVFLASCDPSQQTIKKTHDVTGEYIDIRVMTFSNQNRLQRYLEKNGMTSDEVDGLAQWAHPKDDLTKVNRCEIYVVEPSGVRDTTTLSTWGHELAHCIYGSFHAKGER